MSDTDLAEALAEVDRRYGRPLEYHEPEPDSLILPAELESWRCHELHPHPFYEQGQLFVAPSLEDQAEAVLRKFAVKIKGDAARIRNLARTLGISESRARSVYNRVIERNLRRAQWKHYRRNQAYYEWLCSPKRFELHNARVQLLDSWVEREKRQFMDAVLHGREHVIEVLRPDPELIARLDTPSIGLPVCYQGPLQWWLDNCHVSERDFRLLWENGTIQILEGNPETVFSAHTFFAPDGVSEEMPANDDETWGRCADCGAELDQNLRGLNIKLGYRPPHCLTCLGISETEAQNIIRYYRDSGCTLFA